jgi:RDD family protein
LASFSSSGRVAAERVPHEVSVVPAMATPTHRDPRTIVTPDAFEVSSELLGMPLALPRRRGAALLIDGIVIIFITMLTKSFSLILGVVAAGLFMRAGFKRTRVRGNVFGRAMRFSVGCLGLFIAITTASLWAALGFDLRPGGDGSSRAEDFDFAGLGEQLAHADSLPGVAGWADVVDSLLSAVGEDSIAGDSIAEVALEGAAMVEGSPEAIVAGYSDGEALQAYARLIADSGTTGIAQRRLLQARLMPMVAGDSIGALQRRVARLERDVDASDRALARSTAELESASRTGILDRLLGLADELGFGFGWAAVYMTVFLSWWKGQTIGKRMMRIRVVRLDGEPITWWVAFERVGGYAAGLFTGLLGFAQVWWDANRQAIHDRIVGTVVVVDGAEKVTDWETAL